MSLRLLVWWPRGSSLDSSAGGGDKGLPDDALCSLVPGHSPRFPLEADLLQSSPRSCANEG
jgi:hypothetical protein